MKLDVHPLAELFPDLSASEFSEMVQSIKDDGLDEPIVVSDGKILDGRHRYKACLKAGVNPTTVAYDGAKTPEAIAKFVWRANGVRRHLTASQRSMIAAKMANAPRGDQSNTPIGVLTQGQAAEAVGASLREVQRAARVLKDAAPEVAEAVTNGEVTVTDAAAIAEAPKPAQRKAVKQVKSGKAKTLKAALEPHERGGKQKNDPRLFERLRSDIGKLARSIDDLNRAMPADKFRRAMHGHCDGLLGSLKDWQRAVR